MQYPTCTNIRIRSIHDAHKIFYAVQQGLLQMVTRRLDADERMQLRTGCVYAWEERGPHTELTGLGIERFTEGRRWSPSRVRDEFLFYYEKYSPSPDCANPHPPRDWDPLVKQTYSVWVETVKGRRKWHLTAYFTQATVDQLGSIDDMRVVRDLVVPEGIFKSTRVTKTRSKTEESNPGECSKSPSANAASISRYAPFPAPEALNQSDPSSSGQVLMYQPYPHHHQHHLQDNVNSPPVKPRSPNLNSTPGRNLRDLNQHHTQPYRPLRPSPNPRTNAGHTFSDSPEQLQVASKPQLTPQVHLPGQCVSPSHTHAVYPTHISTAGPSTSSSHGNVNAMDVYTPNAHTFPAVSAPEWVEGSVGALGLSSSSVYYSGSADRVSPSAVQESQPPYLYPHPQHELGVGTSAHTFQPSQYLNHGQLTGGGSDSRGHGTLPSLNIPQEAYSICYHGSVPVASPTETNSTSGSSSSGSTSSSSGSQKSRPNNMSGPYKDLALAPLNALARSHPYRREPMDDRTLRLLGPRSS